MAKQTYDERLAEVSRATIDAKLLGCGFLMLLPDGTYKHVAVERIWIDEKRPAQPQKEGT